MRRRTRSRASGGSFAKVPGDGDPHDIPHEPFRKRARRKRKKIQGLFKSALFSVIHFLHFGQASKFCEKTTFAHRIRSAKKRFISSSTHAYGQIAGSRDCGTDAAVRSYSHCGCASSATTAFFGLALFCFCGLFLPPPSLPLSQRAVSPKCERTESCRSNS